MNKDLGIIFCERFCERKIAIKLITKKGEIFKGKIKGVSEAGILLADENGNERYISFEDIISPIEEEK